MLILSDNGTPRGLKRFLGDLSVVEARERGWAKLNNRDLVEAAERDGFDLMITTDENIRYQQDLRKRKIALLVLQNSAWPLVP